MRNRHVGRVVWMIVMSLALGVIVAQCFVAQGPPQGGAPGGPGGGAPGGAPGGRGGPVGGAGGGQRGGGAPAAPAGPIPRTADGKPDMTGYYTSTTTTNINTMGARGVILDEAGAKGGKIPYNPEWEAKAADTAKNHMFDEPYAHCLPAGVPTNFGIQMGFQVVQGANTVAFAWDTVGGTRLIYMDDRKAIPGNIKLYQGDSYGHWDGDTLVVNTASIAAGWWDASGAVHSDASKVVERFTMQDSNTILYEATVEDPIALTRPMKISDNFRRNLTKYPNSWDKRPSGYEQTETACVEGDMDMALYPTSSGGNSKDAPASTVGVSAPAAGAAPAGGRGGPGGAPGGGRGGPGGAAPAPPAQ